MMRVKQLLTEVLLDVTNTEIVDVARVVYMSARTKQARGSTALHCVVIAHVARVDSQVSAVCTVAVSY